MAGVFGKDPNMNKAGGHKELDRVMGERLRKKAESVSPSSAADRPGSAAPRNSRNSGIMRSSSSANQKPAGSTLTASPITR